MFPRTRVRFRGTGTMPEIDGPEPPWYRTARTRDFDEIGGVTYRHADHTLHVHTSTGILIAYPGDWIVCAEDGQLNVETQSIPHD